MFKVFKKNIHKFEAMATLIGCSIGAGILGLPYVFAKAGFLTGLITLIIITLIIIYINLAFGEIVLRTKEKHQLIGYAEKYLGKKGKILMTISALLMFFMVLAAYILAAGKIINQLFGLNEVLSGIIFFLFFAGIIYSGLKLIEESELISSIIIVGLILLLGIFVIPKISISNIFQLNFKYLLLPYGTLLFAFFGTAAIPEMVEELGKKKKDLFNSILMGSITIAIIYLIFTIIIVGLTGSNTTGIAVIGLAQILGPIMIIFGNIFALFALLTSAIPISLATKEIFNYDFKFNEKLSFVIATLIPLFLYFFIRTSASFILILNVVGAIFCGTQLVLILLMLKNSKILGDRKPEYSIFSSKLINIILIILVIVGAFQVLI